RSTVTASPAATEPSNRVPSLRGGTHPAVRSSCRKDGGAVEAYARLRGASEAMRRLALGGRRTGSAARILAAVEFEAVGVAVARMHADRGLKRLSVCGNVAADDGEAGRTGRDRERCSHAPADLGRRNIHERARGGHTVDLGNLIGDGD